MSVAIAPGSPEHMRMITPSKVSAILGISRFTSPYRIWHQMRGNLPPEPASEIFARGHDFEPAMAEIWRRENEGWRLSRGEVQIVCEPSRFGFPAAATVDRRASRGRARKVVEFKTTSSSLEEWGDFYTDQAPADNVAQVLVQQLITGWTDQPADLLVLGPRLDDHHTYRIPFDAQIADMIVARCRDFYASLKSDEPPALDDTKATYNAVRELHPDIDGSTVDVAPQLAADYLSAHRQLKAAEQQARAAKTRLLDAMGNAQHAVSGGLPVGRRQPAANGAVALYAAKTNPEAVHPNE